MPARSPLTTTTSPALDAPPAAVDLRWIVDGRVLAHDRRGPPSSSGLSVAIDLVGDPATRTWRLRSEHGHLSALPPDDQTVEALAQLEVLPGVDVRFCLVATGAPFGPVALTYQVVDGRPVAIARHRSHEPPAECDVWFRFPYRRVLALAAGRLTPGEVMAPPGELGGDLDMAMLVSGLVTRDWLAHVDLTVGDLDRLDALCRVLGGRPLEAPPWP